MDPSRIARALGGRGGLARAQSDSELPRIASIGGTARRDSLQAAQRIADNFRYVAAIRGLAPAKAVKRLREFRGPLPGLHRAK